MYDYQREKPHLFTDAGQRVFLKIRDQVQRLLKEAGAVRAGEAMRGISATDTFQMFACIERLVELGELRAVNDGPNTAGQDVIYTFGTAVWRS